MRSSNVVLRMRSLAACLLCSLAPLSARAEIVALPSYNIDVTQTSVSGLSSGAFMAVQFGVANSAMIKGVGVMAGGPYFCAQRDLQTAQMQCMAALSPIDVSELIRITDRHAQAGDIDTTGNLKRQRIWLFSGTQDQVVRQAVGKSLQNYYRHYVAAENIFHEASLAAGHAVPTDSFGNPCSATSDPYINNCGYDGAGELLKWIHGELNLPSADTLQGSFVEFDQGKFIANPNSHSMADSGWLYVPDSCKDGEACRLHIAFHGCKQYPNYQYFSGGGMTRFGRTFVDNAGYNRWADTNNMVVLYPQTTNGRGNPNGCWDWWGYDDPNYAKKTGRQMAAVRAMATALASPVLPAPKGLTATAGEHEASLSWQAVDGAAKGYNVYRNDRKVTAAPVIGTRYTDTGLAPGTPYNYQVRAVDASGKEGSASATLQVRTRGETPPVDAPTALMVGIVSTSSVSLSWTGVPNVAGYNVLFRLNEPGSAYMKANTELLRSTDYTVRGLKPGTEYVFTVQAQSEAGVPSANAHEVRVTTASAIACHTASNFAHVRAGRARDVGGFALAKGSNMKMGLDNVFIMTTLKETAPEFYVIDHLTCP